MAADGCGVRGDVTDTSGWTRISFSPPLLLSKAVLRPPTPTPAPSFPLSAFSHISSTSSYSSPSFPFPPYLPHRTFPPSQSQSLIAGARPKREGSQEKKSSLSLSLLLSRPDFCVFFSRSLPAPVSFESGEGRKRARKKDSLFLVSPEALPTYTLECKRYGLSVHIFVRDSLRRQR